jgi:hypothetical protein
MAESHSHSSGDDPHALPHHPVVAKHKVHINWQPLFDRIQVDPKHNISAVARDYGVGITALTTRYHAYETAVAAKDQSLIDIATGLIDGRSYSRAALGREGDYKLAEIVREKKKKSEIVPTSLILKEATNIYNEVHPLPTRSTPPIPHSSTFLTGFHRRNHLSRNSRHKIKRRKKMSEDKENEMIETIMEYFVTVAEAVRAFGPSYVINADETAGHAVEHAQKSWGVVGQPNLVNTDVSHKEAITTMPAVSAHGDKLPMLVLVKGKSKRAERNKNLPSHLYTDHANKGWVTEEVMVRYIHNIIAPYTQDKPSALIVDDYDPHKTDKVQQACRQHNITLIIVPPGQTAEYQPLDIGIFRHVKRTAKQEWSNDKGTGRPDADTVGRAAERIGIGMDKVTSDNIVGSFEDSNPLLEGMLRRSRRTRR